MKTEIIEKLKDLGLSKNEASIYASLLEIGQTSAGSLIKKTKLHRSVVYETLDKLIARKLVFQLTKKKIAYFQTTDPNKLLEYAKSQERIAEKLVPQLKKMAKDGLPEINIYEGVEAYKKFWIDSYNNMPKGTTDCVSGSIGKKWSEYFGDDENLITEIRIKNNIKWKAIVFEKNPQEIALLKKYPKINEYRFIKRKKDLLGNFNIFGDYALVLHSATEPMVIEIKNKTLVKVFQNIFDIIWEIGKKI